MGILIRGNHPQQALRHEKKVKKNPAMPGFLTSESSDSSVRNLF
ncbi:hypothetical protein GTPT_0664 [Tatumella ptyseos ATCC 33301]|uniref:Uncharacterized protein n=1 Tax=Tatumella ptyseos ATCC 33301 TaxID=1005995 RepID=A0A085JNA6_9GAMM|nr:hypothetical protein GTPT_0664 [Tatumella ptyseos ATCC 33301]